LLNPGNFCPCFKQTLAEFVVTLVAFGDGHVSFADGLIIGCLGA
jgi:hypothetical protein